MINFRFGNKKPNKREIIKVSIIVSLLIAALSQCSKISENTLWDLLDEIQRKFFPQTILNELVLKDPDKINRRVERDVTRAIDKVISEYNRSIQEKDKKYQPRYMDETNNDTLCYTDQCKALAPPMRICSTWIDTCPKD